MSYNYDYNLHAAIDVLVCYTVWFSSNKKKKKIHLPMQETQEMQVQSLGEEDPPEEEMSTHSSGTQLSD